MRHFWHRIRKIDHKQLRLDDKKSRKFCGQKIIMKEFIIDDIGWTKQNEENSMKQNNVIK